MKVHSSLHNDFKKKKKLVSENGQIKFNNKKTKISAKKHTKSSQKWLRRQLNDPFVNAAKIEGYLARSAYKLLEIQHKYHVINKDAKVIIDLGCAPGSWTQAVLTNEQFKDKYVIGLDLLPIKFQHDNLIYIQGDFEKEEIRAQIVGAIRNLRETKENVVADCIICDIAMNAVGNSLIDKICSERILETVLKFCKEYLSKNGNLVCKAIKGADATVINDMKDMFASVYRFKPASSRKDSSELFLIGLKKR